MKSEKETQGKEGYKIPKNIMALAIALLPAGIGTMEHANAGPLPVYPGLGGPRGIVSTTTIDISIQPPPPVTIVGGVDGGTDGAGTGSATGTGSGKGTTTGSTS